MCSTCVWYFLFSWSNISPSVPVTPTCSRPIQVLVLQYVFSDLTTDSTAIVTVVLCREFSLKVADEYNSLHRRLSQPVAGACLVPLSSNHVACILLSTLGDVFFQCWHYTSLTSSSSSPMPTVSPSYRLWVDEAVEQESVSVVVYHMVHAHFTIIALLYCFMSLLISLLLSSTSFTLQKLRLNYDSLSRLPAVALDCSLLQDCELRCSCLCHTFFFPLYFIFCRHYQPSQ